MQHPPESRTPAFPPPDDPQLSGLLRSWQVDALPPPRFAVSVWARIQSRRRPASLSLWEFLGGWLGRCLARPRFAAAYLALVFLLGAGAGSLRGQVRSESAADGLQGRYVQSIDPFLAGVIR